MFTTGELTTDAITGILAVEQVSDQVQSNIHKVLEAVAVGTAL